MIRILKNIPAVGNWLAAIALSSLILKILWLNSIPEIFAGANAIGVIVESVLASIVASYLFFVIVVHVPTENERTFVRPHILRHSMQIVTVCRQQLSAISNSTSIKLELSHVSLENVSKAFSLIAPNSEAPMMFFPGNSPASWLEYLFHHVEKTESHISKILVHTHYIEANLVGLLTTIADCEHFSHLHLIESMPLGNTDMSAWSESFFNYCIACNELNKYLSIASKKYS